MSRLCIILLATILVIGTPPAMSRDLTEGLVAFYPFDGNAQDMSGEDNHGAPNENAILTTDRFGNPDSAYYFNGINSHIIVPGSSSLDSPDTASTQFAWIQLDGFSQVGSTFGPILMKSTSSANSFMYRLDVSQGGFGVAFGNWYNSAGGTYDVEMDTWFNVAAAWDGQTVRFYVNGVLIAEPEITADLNQDGRPLVIGGDYPGAYESFWGKIDEVRVYNRALSGAEIAELAGNQSSSAPFSAPSDLVISTGYPNPFGSSTSISFRIPETSSVTIEVFDLAGRRVRQLAAGEIYSREGTVSWDGRDAGGRLAPSGVYHYRLRTGAGQQATGRVVLQR